MYAYKYWVFVVVLLLDVEILTQKVFFWQAIYGLPLCYGEKVVSLSSHVTVND